MQSSLLREIKNWIELNWMVTLHFVRMCHVNVFGVKEDTL